MVDFGTLFLYLTTIVFVLDLVIWVLFLFQYLVPRNHYKTPDGVIVISCATLMLTQLILAFTVIFVFDRHFSESITSAIYHLMDLVALGVGIFIIRDLVLNKAKIPQEKQNTYIFGFTLFVGLLMFLPIPLTSAVSIQSYLFQRLGSVGILTGLGSLLYLYGTHCKEHKNHGTFSILVLPIIPLLPLTTFNPLSLLGFLGLSIVYIDFITRRTANRSLLNIHSIVDYVRSRMIFKFVVMFTLLIIMAILGTSFSILTLTRNAILQNEHKIFTQMAYSLKTEVENTIEGNTQYLQQLQKNSNIIPNNPLITGAFFYDAVRRNTNVEELMLINQDQIKLVQSNATIINTEPTKVETEPYITAAIKNSQIKKYIAFEKNRLFISIPVLNSEETGFAFSLAGFFNVRNLTLLFTQLQKGTHLTIDIVNPNYFSIQNHGFLNKTDALRKINLKQNGFKRLMFGKEPYFVVLMYDANLNLTYVVKQKESEALAGITKSEQSALMILLGSTLLFIVLGLLLAIILENPIKVISAGLAEFRKGNLDHAIKLTNIDEMGELAKSLNEMASDLKSLFQVKAKSEQLALISTMVVTLNHEINNPLTSILMVKDILYKKLDPIAHADLMPLLNSLEKNGNRVRELIDEISKMNEPVIEDYVEGTKMLKINFTTKN